MVGLCLIGQAAFGLEPIPDRLVVLTFDDSVASHYAIVRPILKEHGFGATFFITEGFSFPTNKVDYMTWEQIAELHRDGFEIGNHTRDHVGIGPNSIERLAEQVEAISRRCEQYGIPRPTCFAYPGNSIFTQALPRLKELGFKFARRGGAPEHPYEWGRGFAFEPGQDHPLLLPSAGDARPDWVLADFTRAVAQATNGRIAILQFHGVPDRDHPWVHTSPDRFREFMAYLKQHRFTVLALRDLARFVDPEQVVSDPEAVINRRKAGRTEVLVEGRIVDRASGNPRAGRISIRGADGRWHFAKAFSFQGQTARYERRSGFNSNAVAMHSSLTAHPFRVELEPGRYRFRVECGKEYLPREDEIEVRPGLPPLELAIDRWVSMSDRGWFSGDAHVHVAPDQIAAAMLAEDVNVVLPMIDWTTASTEPPTASTRGFPGVFEAKPVAVDPLHTWYPKNTEYELFRTGEQNHTLGALLILNHRSRFEHAAIPLLNVVAQVRREQALIDLEKHNWPWSIALVPIAGVDLFELANNHHWQTEFGVRNWAVPAPPYMGFGGTGTDNERDWTLYGFQTYYALLNCGFNIRPTAGTAHGVHPVPLGFSRVYVKLQGSFDYPSWIDGLSAGRSFVTTGPMLLAELNGSVPGRTFNFSSSTNAALGGTILSQEKLESIEIVLGGKIVRRIVPSNTPRPEGGFETKLEATVAVAESSWLAVRCFESRTEGRFRFAHTGPWHFRLPNSEVRPTRPEIDWLILRVQEEIQRSALIAPQALIDDYRRALGIYQEIAKRSR